MIIAILTNDEKWEELAINNVEGNYFITNDVATFIKHDADLYINLNDDAYQLDYSNIDKPVIVNSVVHTALTINAKKCCRINGWNGFLQRHTWEAAGYFDATTDSFFSQINKKIIRVNDEVGFISARILSMIINEAWYALEAQVSTKESIDTAMKLGTNYPSGPFEWAERIGLNNILYLLEALAKEETKYSPCNLMMEAITK